MKVICNKCNSYIQLAKMNPTVPVIKFCVTCGSDNIYIDFQGENYWQELADRFNITTTMAKMLFITWDIKTYPTFIEYVKKFKSLDSLVA